MTQAARIIGTGLVMQVNYIKFYDPMCRVTSHCLFFSSCFTRFVAFLLVCLKNLFLGAQVITPMPYKYINTTLNSDISSIISELSSLVPQFSSFISQFNEVITQTGISVVTDSAGNMSIDVPGNMSDTEAGNISKRIGVIDRLIATRTQEIEDLIKKGVNIENNLRNQNPNYVSQLSDKIAEFNRLKTSYKH